MLPAISQSLELSLAQGTYFSLKAKYRVRSVAFQSLRVLQLGRIEQEEILYGASSASYRRALHPRKCTRSSTSLLPYLMIQIRILFQASQNLRIIGMDRADGSGCTSYPYTKLPVAEQSASCTCTLENMQAAQSFRMTKASSVTDLQKPSSATIPSMRLYHIHMEQIINLIYSGWTTISFTSEITYSMLSKPCAWRMRPESFG